MPRPQADNRLTIRLLFRRCVCSPFHKCSLQTICNDVDDHVGVFSRCADMSILWDVLEPCTVIATMDSECYSVTAAEFNTVINVSS